MSGSPKHQKYTPAPAEDANGDVELNNDKQQQNDIRDTEKGGKELTVYYTGDSGPRRRTTLEKYLIVLCILLFIACLAFIVIAFTRDVKKGR